MRVNPFQAGDKAIYKKEMQEIYGVKGTVEVMAISGEHVKIKTPSGEIKFAFCGNLKKKLR